MKEDTKNNRGMEDGVNPPAENDAEATAPFIEGEGATPNRDAYKESFNEDYPDVDFEDKEARYGKMVEDRKRLKSYQRSGQKLNETFNKNRWLAAMVQDISESDDPEYSPIDWMADHGIDIGEAMEDEATRKKVSEKIAQFQKTQLEGEQEKQERQENFVKSAEALRSLGLDDDQANEMWVDFFTNVVDPALRGEVSAETWKMIQKGKNYDDDIASAKETSAMQARNEKLTNNVKNFDDMPPSLSQGGAGQQTRKKKKRSFFDDLKEAGY